MWEKKLNFDLSDELRDLQTTCRRFVDQEVIPVEMTALEGPRLRTDLRETWERKAKAMGFWALDAPEELGGGGLGLLGMSIVWREMARTPGLPPRGPGIFGPECRLQHLGLKEDQVRRYLKPLVEGTKKTAFAQSEPQAGGDPGGMYTTAVRHGDIYKVNGVKHFISHAADADFVQLVAASDRAKGSKGGLSVFLVDMDTPGIEITGQQATMSGELTYEITFSDVSVPAANMVGVEGEGMARAQTWLTAGRLYQASYCLGVAQRSLELAASYANDRVTFGAPLATRQAVQFKLVDMFAELEVATAYLNRVAWHADQGTISRHEAMVCKTFCTELGFKAADACMQIHGGMGLMADLPIHRMWMAARSFMITEGPVEVMRATLARQVLKTYA